MKFKKTIATVALAGAVTAGTIGLAGAASAADSPSGSTPAATTQRHPRLRLYVRRHAAKIVANTLGVSVADLRTALKGGQSVNEYAASLQKDPKDVKDALVNAADKALDTAVQKGWIDQSRADVLKGKVPDRVDKLMDRQFGQHAAQNGTA
jgi:ribosomal protein S20